MISRALCKNQDPGEELGELEEQRERERESKRYGEDAQSIRGFPGQMCPGLCSHPA